MSTQRRPHANLTLSKEDFDTRNLKHSSYNYDALSEAVVEYNQRLSSSDRSKWAPRQLQAWKQLKHDGTWHLGNPDNYQDIRKWYDIFDDACFNGLLRGLCEIEFVESEELGAAGKCSTWFPDQVEHGDFQRDKAETKIQLSISTKRTPYWNIVHHLDTLLHEMLHAFFGYYRCCCATCLEEYHSGHGKFWQRAAKVIEDTFYQDREGFNLGIDLHRNMGFASDVNGGSKMLKKHELRELNLDRSEIRKDIQYLRRKDKDPQASTATHAADMIADNAKHLAADLEAKLSNLSECGGHHIPKRLCQDFELGMSKPSSYSAEDITITLIKSWSRSKWHCGVQDLMPRQQLAIKQFQISALWRFDGSISLEELTTFFQIFDNAYFNGLLSEYCTLRIVQERFVDGCTKNCHETKTSAGKCETQFPGYAKDTQYCSEKPRVVINIPTEFHDIFRPVWRPYFVHDALLHQMIHAFFDIYQCRCDEGCEAENLQRPKHSTLWDALVIAMIDTDKTGRKFLGLNLRLKLWYWRNQEKESSERLRPLTRKLFRSLTPVSAMIKTWCKSATVKLQHIRDLKVGREHVG